MPAMRLRAALAIVVGAVALRLAVGVGFANYDTLYSLVWGQQVARGEKPTYNLALAPTPHPRLEALGVILAPLGAAATVTVVVALAYLALASLGYLVYRLGADWFGTAAGLAAAALILSRYEVLSYGVRAYVDEPYVVLVLTALAIETRRRRAGWPVIAMLDLAGLLRPEAWLFAAAYWLYLWRGESPRRRVALAALVAAAPVLWAISDLAVTGNALWSLTNTRATARQLHRATGLANVPYYGARRLGEVLGPDGLVAAAVGLVFALWLARRRALLGAVALTLAAVALALLAGAGLPIQDRYVFTIAALGAVFGGAGLFGWRTLAPEDPRRRRWQAGSVVVAVAVVASIAWQVPRFQKTFDSTRPADQSLGAQQRIAADLVSLTRSGAINVRCTPISVPYDTPVPLLALYLHISPAKVVIAPIRRGTWLEAADGAVRREYELDPRERQRDAGVPAGFRSIAANRSWHVFARCRGPEGPP